MRKLLALSLLGALLVAPSASAKAKPKPPPPKPVCNLITDASGDAVTLVYGHPELNRPNDPQLDILSVDIATDATRLTVVWRLSADPAKANPNWKFSRQYAVSGFAGDGKLFAIHTLITPTGTEFGDGKGTGVLDSKLNQIRTTVPLSALPAAAAAPKASFRNLTAQARTWIGNTSGATGIAVSNTDQTAESTKPYVGGTPSCVKVGA